MPTKDRQRALARAKLERQMAKRAEAARKRRQIMAGIAAAVGLAVVIAGTVWLIATLGGDDDDKKADKSLCSYQTVPSGGQAKVKDVGKPSTENIARSGTQVATLTTNFGDIKIDLDQSAAPCTANSWVHLAQKGFYDNTLCHRMTDALVQCGDPFADGVSDTDGQGGPSYKFAGENLPTGIHPTGYTRGTVAMANSGPDSNGSQFFILWDDAPYPADYTIVGKVTEDTMATLDALKAVGNDGAFDPNPGGGRPKQQVTITSLKV